MAIRKLITTYEGGDCPLPGVCILEGGEYAKDFKMTEESDRFPLSIQLAITMLIYIVVRCKMTIQLGKQTFDLDETHPLIWAKAGGLKCPIDEDVTEIVVTNCEKPGPNVIQVRVLEDQKPAAAAATVPTPAPAPPATSSVPLQLTT